MLAGSFLKVRFMENYYYNRMTKPQQAAYHAIQKGLEAMAPSIQVPRIDGKDLAQLYFLLRLDHPEIFYSASYKYRYYEHADSMELIPEYLFEKKKIQQHQAALKARVEKLARPAKELKTEWDKLIYIHDFICQNVQYDKLRKPYAHEIIGPLGQGVGVCEGMAKSVKILCDTLGIWCVIAISEANPDNGVKYRHAWNIVKIGSRFYHLDTTFDNGLCRETDDIRYDYFCLPDKQIFRDHEALVWPMPKCEDGDSFYYKVKKLSWTKEEEVRKRCAQAVKKGKILTFHWRGDYLTRERLKDFLHIFEEEAAKKEKHAHVRFNWSQAVLRVSFDVPVVEDDVEIEEVDASTR